jgi:ADP-ribose pyrophosphatase YjhB (NUDIX family)
VPTLPPHLMTSAVVLDAGGTRTLLARGGEYGRWDLLHGHVEGGESLAEAARRHVREQSGLTRFGVVEPHLAVQQDVLDCGHGEARHVDHVFAVIVESSEPAGTFAGEGGDEGPVAWFPVTDLPEPTQPGVRLHIRSAIRTAFGS